MALPPFGFSPRPGSSFNRYGQIDPGRSLPIAEDEEEEAHPRSPGSIQGHTIHQCSTLEILRKGSLVGARWLAWERLYGCVGDLVRKKKLKRVVCWFCAIMLSPTHPENALLSGSGFPKKLGFSSGSFRISHILNGSAALSHL